MRTRLFLLSLCLVWVVGCDGNRDPDDVDTSLDDLETASVFICNQANCMGGANDLDSCTDDAECDGGTCEIFAPVLECDGGAASGQPCTDDFACGSACVGGSNSGRPCFTDENCGRFCEGGTGDGNPCVSDATCGGGVCVAPYPCVAGTCEQVGLGCNEASPLVNFDFFWDSCENLDAALTAATLPAEAGSTTGPARKMRVSGCNEVGLYLSFSSQIPGGPIPIGCVSVEFDKEGEAPIQVCDNPIDLSFDVP
jgi:hypothetical protein